jgi:2-oxoglutarate ferredoxin oxidoreductase subunit alpha
MQGHISEDPVNRVEMMDKRLQRFTQILENIPKDEQILSHSTGEICVISWGSTKGPIIDAIEMLKNEGIDIGFVQIKLLHPFPKETLETLLKDCKTLINIEAIRQNLLREPDYYVLKYTGRAMTCDEIYNSLKKIVTNKAEKMEVLTYGA